MASTKIKDAPMTAEERKVIFASSLGTVFEWYDFYLYGSLAAIIAKQFFAGLDPTSGFIFALLAFGHLFGFVGVLIALPASAVLLVAIRRAKRGYLGSEMYLGETPRSNTGTLEP